jgi:ABC-type sugar transport system substrate-binding protein
MEDLIQRYGSQIQGVYAFGATMAVGAVQALTRANVKLGKTGVAVVGASPTADAAAAMKNGTLWACADQIPFIIYDAAVAAMVAHLEGKAIPATIEVPVQIVTAETAGSYSFGFNFTT